MKYFVRILDVTFWAIILNCWPTVLQTTASGQFQAVLIRLEDDQEISVRAVENPSIELDSKSQGIIVWSDGETEAWQYISPGGNWSPPRTRTGASYADRFAGSRALIGDGGSAPEAGQLTTQIDQLLGVTVFRGKSFLTPHNGALLNPKLTIRRQPQTDGLQFPAAVAILQRGNTEIARIPFTKNQQKLAYDQIPELAKRMPTGLAAGEYTLRIEGTAESAAFTVEDGEWAEVVMEVPNQVAELVSSRTKPLFIQVAVETLLDQRDEDDKPLAYLSDALDLLESVPFQQLTVHLRSVHTGVLQCLQGKKQQNKETTLVATGIPVIDRARAFIAAGRWRDAAKELDGDIPDEPRAVALAKLHRAVILAESGLGNVDAADGLFRQAIAELQNGSASDRFLAHNNAGNFLLNQAQDRLYNHAFQMAAGVRQPLLTALTAWQDAYSQYQAAMPLADELDANQRAGVLVNTARLQVLLADILRTLDVATSEVDRRFRSGELAAARLAAETAAKVSEAKRQDIEPLVRAAGEELQAHLAFRARESDACLSHAKRALAAYLDAGSLAGAEGIHRLLGLYHRRSANFTPDGKAAPESSQLALNHFLISMHLAEMLREKIPADQFGLSQAGFFARRAYVNEQVIELMIAKGDAAAALHYAEMAKARSLQDLLAIEQTGTTATYEDESRTTAELLDDWPGDVAALEYFLGMDKAWLFSVNTAGDVQAWDLLGDQRKSRDLVADVRRFLNSIEFYSKRSMHPRALRGLPFDHSWQETLHAFRTTLIPNGVLEKLREADTVVIVPHHILHYFPFAALVTKQDENRPDVQYEMVLPQFLIDEKFDLVYEPSLTAWDTLRRRRDRPIRQVGAVGIVDFPMANPLPGVTTDMKNLQAAFGDSVEQILFGDQATEAAVQQMLTRRGMLLFATHGVNQADQPLQSYLLCLQDQHSDGYLTAAELFGTDIQSDLIVMSVCYSGLADRSPLPGDDLFGVQRALLQSGAATVVSGLWDVLDVTGPMLMQGFFDRLADGTPAATALAESQRAFLKEHREAEMKWFTHPYFWAVYQTAGNDRTRFAK